jgi:hypothetical protein
MTDHIRPEVRALAERCTPITIDEWEKFRGNSWETEFVLPKLDDKALAHVAEYILSGTIYDHERPFSTFNAMLPGLIVPELLRRLSARQSAGTFAKVTEMVGTHLPTPEWDKIREGCEGEPADLTSLLPEQAVEQRGTWRITVEFTPSEEKNDDGR